MPKERGPERDFVVRWAFDMEYGGCSRFWWGGEVRQRENKWQIFDQGGNRNNFEAKEECDEICVRPEGKRACNLPMVPGPCEGSYFHYGYNRDRGICEQFKYGGCLGMSSVFC